MAKIKSGFMIIAADHGNMTERLFICRCQRSAAIFFQYIRHIRRHMHFTKPYIWELTMDYLVIHMAASNKQTIAAHSYIAAAAITKDVVILKTAVKMESAPALTCDLPARKE